VHCATFVPSAEWPEMEPVFDMQGYAKSCQIGHKHHFYGHNRRWELGLWLWEKFIGITEIAAESVAVLDSIMKQILQRCFLQCAQCINSKADYLEGNNTELWVFHPVVCTYNGIFNWTVVTQQCGSMFRLCNKQLSLRCNLVPWSSIFYIGWWNALDWREF